jgi:hypothetical protein
MAKISTYPIVSVPDFSDLLIGTDVENLNETKNFTIGDIADLIIVGSYVPYTGAINDVDLGIHSITASSFIVPGGLASQFVKADGSLDSTVYQPAGNYMTGLSGEATASGPGVSAVVLSNGAVIGKVLTGLTVTGGSISSSDSILQAFGKLQNQVNSLYGGAIYQGTWNALTNNPLIQSGVGTKGYYYVVNVAGTTNIDGITDWHVGDWIIFDGTAWQQVDNTDTVVSVNGKVGVVVLTTTDIAEGTNLYYTDVRARGALLLTTVGNSGASTYNSLTGTFNIPNYTLSGLGGVPSSRLLTINGTQYDLSADRSWSVGTVTSIGTSGPLTGGTITGSGTIGITQSGVSTDGYLSSTDWNTFNNKQNALTNPVTGTGTVYYLPMWSGLTTLTDSIISYTANVINYNYNSASGATVNYININGTPYTYTIQMNNVGTRQTYHSYTDGNIIQRIGVNDVSRNLSTGQLVLPSYTTLTSFTGTTVGYIGFDASGNILTVPIPTAGITGSGATGQVAYWNGTSSQTGSANFLWDNTNQRLSITGQNLATTTTISAICASGTFSLNNASQHYVNTTLSQTSSQGAVSHALTNNSSLTGSFVLYGSAEGNNLFGTSRNSALALLNNSGTKFYLGTINSTDLIFGTTNLERMRLFAGGNFNIGGATDGGQRLQVQGDAFIKGSGATSATTALQIQNSGSANILRVLNDTTLKIGSQNVDIFPTADGSSVSNAGRGLIISTAAASQGTGALKVVGTSLDASGNNWSLWLSHTFGASSGTATHSGLLLNQTINQTGGANGITRGLYIAPTLTSAADWRAIEVSAGITILAPSTTSSASLRLPNGVAPTTPTNGDIWSTTTDLLARINNTTYSLINSGLSGSGAAGQVTYWDSATNITGSNNLFWDAANSRLGIGTNLPSYNLHNVGTTGLNAGASADTLTILNGGYIVMASTRFRATSTQFQFQDDAFNNKVIINTTATISYFNTGGNYAFGKTTDSGQRLQVEGDAFIKGSGATSATVGLTVQNSSGTNIFRVRNDGFIAIGNNSNRPFIFPFTNGAGSQDLSGTNLSFYNYTSTESSANGLWSFENTATAQTSGNNFFIRLSSTFAPTSGTSTFALLAIQNTINQTGGANGITRGLYVNPALTAAADWRAIEWSNNSGWGLYGAGTAPSYLNGSLGIGSTSLTVVNFRNQKTISGGVTSYANLTDGIVQQAVTSNAFYYATEVATVNIAFTLPNLYHYRSAQGTFGASSTVTNQFGFYVDSSLISATNNFGFYGAIANGTNRWNLYLTGADNYIGSKLLIGTTTVGTQRLQVNGDTLLKGSGPTSATSALLVQNSSGTDMFTILNNGYTRYGNQSTSAFRVYPGSVSGAGDVDLSGEFLVLNSRSSTTETGGSLGNVTINGVNVLGTSGIFNPVSISRTFAPTSGTAVFNMLNFVPVINQTGGANGTTRGLYINPVLTAAADWRSIEWSNNSGWGLYGAGTAPNYLGGNLTVSRNQNAVTRVDLINTTSGTGSYTEYRMQSSSGTASLGKYSATTTAYKFINANDTFLFNDLNAGDIAFLNDFTTGKIKWGAGASSTAQMTLTAAGRLLLGTTTESTFLLDVNGTARVSGVTTLSGAVAINSTNVSTGYALFVNGVIGAGILTLTDELTVGENFAIKNNGSQTIDIDANNNSTNAIFRVTCNGTANELFRVNESGNFMLGTLTDAGYKFDVNGTARFSNTLSVISTATTNETAIFRSVEPYITIEATGASNPASVFLKPSTASQNATIQNRNGGGLEFYVNADYTTPKMTIKGTTVNISSLPTSSAGLATGDIWNDSGTLKVA